MTGVFLMRQFFVSVPNELLESARMDGANEGMIFAKIMMPICKPQIAILAIFSFRWRWNDYISAAAFLEKSGKIHTAVGIENVIGSRSCELDRFVGSLCADYDSGSDHLYYI